MMKWLLGAICAVMLVWPHSTRALGPVFAQKDTPQLPNWMQLCGSDFVSFVGRRWLLSSNAKDKTKLLDEVNFWTVQRRSILSVRAFQYGEGLRAFVAVDLGKHRLSKDGRPIDIVISGDGYRLLMTCLTKKSTTLN